MQASRLILPALACCLAFAARAEDEPVFKDRNAQESYAIGAQTARTLRKDKGDVDVEMLIRGLRDGFGDGRLLMSEQDLKAVMSRVQQDMHKNLVLNRRAEAQKNRDDATRWLADHAKQPNVKVTPSGLQYTIVKEGKGAAPALNDTVLANYRGTLPDGREFETSAPGKPAQMFVMQTIPGMREALQMMPVGSHWQIAIPPALAYGERGSGAEIGPNQLVLFDVELVDIRKMKDSH
jgi:FKBP-type peptidyl-prolyl cis-trans isomerase FklB